MGFRWHGCTKCMKSSDFKIKNDPHSTMRLRRESTARKLRKLRELGYTVKVMWECEFIKILSEDVAMKRYLDEHPLVCEEPLNVRDSYYGGRTECIRRYAEAIDNKCILEFSDHISLYPYAMKYSEIPVSHATIHLDNFPDITKINGIIKCVVLPPKNLFLPLLPSKMNNKLLFVLCRTCGETLNQKKCRHNDTQRALHGTWVLSEIHKAIELKYEIKKIIEVWEFKTLKLDKATKQGGVFQSYINALLKLKQEASSWPSWCIDEETKNRYIDEYFQSEGIQLDAENISLNVGMRAIAKLLLNSLYGKFGQREDKKQTKIIKNPTEFYSMLCDPNVEINNIICVGQECLVVNYSIPIELMPPNNTINCAIAAFITAGARLHLYSYLERNPRSVVYMDTGKKNCFEY